jgi:hypothetical protein
MADKMIREDDLRDKFLSELTGSEEELHAPAGFTAGVLNRISTVAPVRQLRPYTAPWWLKWGIPLVAFASLAAILAIGAGKEPASAATFNFHEKLTQRINSWLVLNQPDITIPKISVPDNLVLILGGLTVLLWGFWFLVRYLNKKSETTQRRF